MPQPLEPWLFYAGSGLCCLVVLQAILGGLGLWRSRESERRRSCDDAEAFRQEVQAAVVAARARLTSGLGWSGRRPLRVAAIDDEATGVKSFYLTSSDGVPLPAYLPGQYLTLLAPVEPHAEPLMRCYSLSDRPRSECYRITVKRDGGPTPNEPDRPYGQVSSWLHTQVQVGDEILCEAPRGAFFYDPATDRPVVLLGAGVGITPIMSMLLESHHHGHRKPVYAFLSYRDGTNHLFREPIHAIAQQRDTGGITVAYSRPRAEDRSGEDYQFQGRISVELLRHVLPSNNFDFYLCGPGRMMQELVPELLDWGVPDDAIHYEAFGPASLSLPSDPPAVTASVGCEVRFAEDQSPLTWDGTHTSLLDLAEASGVPIASGCRVGNCGACRLRVVEGSTTTFKKAGMTVGKGECLACISQPTESLLLET